MYGWVCICEGPMARTCVSRQEVERSDRPSGITVLDVSIGSAIYSPAMEPDDNLDLTDLEAMVLALLDQGGIVVDAETEESQDETS